MSNPIAMHKFMHAQYQMMIESMMNADGGSVSNKQIGREICIWRCVRIRIGNSFRLLTLRVCVSWRKSKDFGCIIYLSCNTMQGNVWENLKLLQIKSIVLCHIIGMTWKKAQMQMFISQFYVLFVVFYFFNDMHANPFQNQEKHFGDHSLDRDQFAFDTYFICSFLRCCVKKCRVDTMWLCWNVFFHWFNAVLHLLFGKKIWNIWLSKKMQIPSVCW